MCMCVRERASESEERLFKLFIRLFMNSYNSFPSKLRLIFNLTYSPPSSRLFHPPTSSSSGAGAAALEPPADRDSPDGYPIDFSTNRGPDLDIMLPGAGVGQEVHISGYWTNAKTNEVDLPKRLTCKVITHVLSNTPSELSIPNPLIYLTQDLLYT